MENTYFKGLDKALDDNCYIIVFNCSYGWPVVRVEKKNRETGEVELVSYAKNFNAIAALNTASYKIVDELGDKKDIIDSSEFTLIDGVLASGYTLHFYKLSNGQVLSTICCLGDNVPFDYIPVKSIMSNDVRTGLELLNVSLECFKDKHDSYFYDNLFNFVSEQTEPVKKHLKKSKSDLK